jgi:2-(3-amino-3-carboxypropyl)histidine synthase
MTIRINEERIHSIIAQVKPKTVLFNAPGGLIKQTRELMEKIEKNYGIRCIFSGDTCYGICDYTESDARNLGADAVIHVGHSATIDSIGNYIFFVEAYDDVRFDDVIDKAAQTLHSYKKVGLATYSQHLHMIAEAKQRLENFGFDVFVGGGNNLLQTGQVFGCDFSTIFNLKDVVDTFLFLGQSEFHAVGIAIATGKPTYMLDPYFNEIVDMEKQARERIKKAILAVYRAADASSFGVITGLKEGQLMRKRSEWITKKLEMLGKKVFKLAMREITPERLAPYRDIEAFIQTACPRISIDGYNFDRPILSIPQSDALVRLLEGRDVGDFLVRPKWIELTVGLIKRS